MKNISTTENTDDTEKANLKFLLPIFHVEPNIPNERIQITSRYDVQI